MAKQMLVTLPIILLVLDYWPLKRFTLRGRETCNPERTNIVTSLHNCILEKIPFLLLSVIAGLIVYLIQHRTGIVKSVFEYPLVWRIGNAFVVYVVYFLKMLWPNRLTIFYPHPGANLSIVKATASVIFLTFTTIFVIRQSSKHPYLITGWLWYLITLVPVIGLVQIGMHGYADRYTYVPLTGLFIIIAWGFPELIGGLKYKKIILFPFAVVLLTVLAFVSWFQVKHWQNNMSLYKHAVEVFPNNAWALHYLGCEQVLDDKLDEAVASFTKALQIEPDWTSTKNALGNAFIKQGNFDEAIKLYKEFLPELPDGVELGRPNIALNQAGKMAEIVKVYTSARTNLGIALARRGEFDQAVRQFKDALRIRPDLIITHKELANVFLMQGRLDEAVKHFKMTLQLESEQGDAMNILARLLTVSKDAEYFNPDEAILLAEHACELTKYMNPEPIDTLAIAYAASGRFSEAIETAEKAMKLAESAGDKKLSMEIQERLKLYRAERPYIEQKDLGQAK
jgi:tetratricopeptide (TPR) repeat protein